MFGSFLNTIFRHLRRDWLFTLLKVLGLTIGISACWVIFSIVDYEYSFDKKVPHREDIFRIVTKIQSGDQQSSMAGVPEPMASAIRENIPGVRLVVPISGYSSNKVTVTTGNGTQKTFEDADKAVFTEDDYFKLIPYHWLAGSPQHALDAPDNVVLTQSRAERYFPGIPFNDIPGKVLVYNDTTQRVVSGIVADLHYPSSFPGKEFLTLPSAAYASAGWDAVSSSDALYVTFAKNVSHAAVLKQLDALSTAPIRESMKQYQYTRWHELLPLSEVHFSSKYGEGIRKANKSVLYVLAGIAVFLILLAAINYINLSTAQIPQRAREIGIRKTLGSSMSGVTVRFLSETGILVLASTVISFFLSHWTLVNFRGMMPEGLTSFSDHFGVFLFIAITLVVITCFSGWYPGWLMSRLQPVRIINAEGTMQSRKGRLHLRKSLIVFQFVIAELFIIGSIVVARQLRFVLKSDMGFAKEGVLLIKIPDKIRKDSAYAFRKATLTQELKHIPGIESISVGTPPLTDSYFGNVIQYTAPNGITKSFQAAIKHVDTAFIGTYKLAIIAGHNFSTTAGDELLINETACRQLGFSSPGEAVGKFITFHQAERLIAGVVKDFHSAKFYNKIEPTLLTTLNAEDEMVNIRLHQGATQQWQVTRAQIKKVWKKLFPAGDFTATFYDQKLEDMYKSEQYTATIVNLASTIAIVLSCLGLFGLSYLTAFQRIKEIGIRKVLGASVGNITSMLSRGFLFLVLLAICIASPLGWWIMNKWLQSFAYRIQIKSSVFLLAAVSVMLIALVTVSLQAIKAARANPVESLRAQ